MNARLLAAFLCLTVASTGCIIIDNDGPCCTPPPQQGQPGDVTFIWTFASPGTAGRCADVPDVKKVRITIPGETLYNGGIYACHTEPADGIVLHDFVPGNYSYTVEGLSYNDAVLYKSSGTFTVNGNTRVNTNLTPNGSQSSYAYVSWSFPANTTSSNPNCTQAGVAYVMASIDGGDWERLDCGEGMSGGGVQTPYLSPGSHTIALAAYGSGGETYYYTGGDMVTQSGNPISASFRFETVGSMALRWQLIDGSVSKDCAQAGVTQVSINLWSVAAQQWVYGTVGDGHGCADAPIIYRFLKPGAYKVYIKAWGPGNVPYYSNESAPTDMTVTAYQQKTEADAYTIYLSKQ